jgi:4a-hydroxytetrahydrobiopterin dehydratase
MDLSTKKCVPCEGGTNPFNQEQVAAYLKGLEEGWTVVENKIVREFRFKNYGQTMSFVNKVAEIAEAENHHPVMHVYYAKAMIELWTHSIGSLSENDFILAAKIDRLPH